MTVNGILGPHAGPEPQTALDASTGIEYRSKGKTSTIVQSRQTQPNGISGHIDYIQQQLDEILVSYPPFFPIATFQRLDLIKKTKAVEQAITHSTINPALKNILHGKLLSDDATDGEIATALERLHSFRDSLKQNRDVAPPPTRTGSLLNIKA